MCDLYQLVLKNILSENKEINSFAGKNVTSISFKEGFPTVYFIIKLTRALGFIYYITEITITDHDFSSLGNAAPIIKKKDMLSFITLPILRLKTKKNIKLFR